MTQQLIENLNDMIKYAGGEIRFAGSVKVGKEEVVNITKNQVHVSGRYKFPIMIYFDDFVEINGIGKLFEIYELALTKVPNYKKPQKDGNELKLEMDYSCLLHYNYHQEQYAYFHRNDLKYYFGAGKDYYGKEYNFKVGYGDTPQEAIKDYENK